jgi:putative ABC transport system permease protein
MITLTASLCSIFLIYLIERNLDATFVRSYPPDVPNLFFIDIQPSQQEAFAQTVDRKVRFYPIVRGRVAAVNDEKIDRRQERRKRGDNLGRVFNLTYRNDLLGDEKIIAGETLFQPGWQGPQVSVLDTVTEMREMGLGDTITFKVQGVPIDARISSIRTRTAESVGPFFYFVLPPEVLQTAPQTVFTALRVPEGQVGALQNRIVSTFPNVSVIDISDSIRVLAQLLKRLSTVVRFFSLLGTVAGILILVSAVFATRAARIAESVYYKILGAKKSFIFRVFALENLLIGLLSGLLALSTSQLGAYFICRSFFDIGYHSYLSSCLLMVAAISLLVVAIGMTASKSILAKKPVAYLREQAHA